MLDKVDILGLSGYIDKTIPGAKLRRHQIKSIPAMLHQT